MNNNAELWSQFKKNQSPIIKKQIILNYVNLVHYVIHHSKFAINSILDERDYFQFGMKRLTGLILIMEPSLKLMRSREYAERLLMS